MTHYEAIACNGSGCPRALSLCPCPALTSRHAKEDPISPGSTPHSPPDLTPACIPCHQGNIVWGCWCSGWALKGTQKMPSCWAFGLYYRRKKKAHFNISWSGYLPDGGNFNRILRKILCCIGCASFLPVPLQVPKICFSLDLGFNPCKTKHLCKCSALTMGLSS